MPNWQSPNRAVIYALQSNGDNTLVTLRYRLKNADIQAAEEPFESGGRKFNRGTWILQGVASNDLEKTVKELGLKIIVLPSAPSVARHPVRAARAAILHSYGFQPPRTLGVTLNGSSGP